MAPKKKSDWKPEAFPQPRTIPSGWDTSGLSDTKPNGQQDSQHTQPKKENSAEDWVPEKFPKPRTYPRNWSIDD